MGVVMFIGVGYEYSALRMVLFVVRLCAWGGFGGGCIYTPGVRDVHSPGEGKYCIFYSSSICAVDGKARVNA